MLRVVWGMDAGRTLSRRVADAIGRTSVDTSAVYSVILRDDDLGVLEGILRRFKAQTSQEAIYLEVIRQIDLRLL